MAFVMFAGANGRNLFILPTKTTQIFEMHFRVSILDTYTRIRLHSLTDSIKQRHIHKSRNQQRPNRIFLKQIYNRTDSNFIYYKNEKRKKKM